MDVSQALKDFPIALLAAQAVEHSDHVENDTLYCSLIELSVVAVKCKNNKMRVWNKDFDLLSVDETDRHAVATFLKSNGIKNYIRTEPAILNHHESHDEFYREIRDDISCLIKFVNAVRKFHDDFKDIIVVTYK